MSRLEGRAHRQIVALVDIKEVSYREAAHLKDCDRCGVDPDTYRRVKQRLARLRVPAEPSALSRLERLVDELTSGAAEG